MRNLFLIVLMFGICFDLFALDIQSPMSYYHQESVEPGAEDKIVGNQGEAIYSYPMGNVSAVYSSLDGWKVGVYSKISRSVKWGPPKYLDDPEDVFMLDGMELAESGNRIYHTQKESYKKIKYIDPNSTNSYWIVTHNNGTKSYYGVPWNTPPLNYNARVGRTGMGQDDQPRLWALCKTVDVFNEKETHYMYYKDTSGVHYLKGILTFKQGVPVDNCGFKTELYYDNKPARISYREGTKVVDSVRVKTVVQKIKTDWNGDGGRIVKAYKIEWIESPHTETSLIKSITVYGTNVKIDSSGSIISGDSLSPVSFKYSQISTGFGSKQLWSSSPVNYFRQSGILGGERCFVTELIDMNNDGCADIVKKDGYSPVYVALNNLNSFGPLNSWGNLSDIFYLHRGGDRGHGSQLLTDIDGNGYPDLVRKYPGNNILYVAYNYGNGFQSTTPTGYHLLYVGFSVEDNYDDKHELCDLIDINGDGQADSVKAFEDGKSETDLVNGNFNPNHDVFVNINKNSTDGFGSTQVWTRGAREKALRKTGTDIVTINQGYVTGYKQYYNTLQDLIDINGDGLVDCVNKRSIYDPLYVILNTSKGFDTEANWGNDYPLAGYRIREGCNESLTYTYPGGVTYNRRDKGLYKDMIDMNGDGLVDLVVKDNSDGFIKVVLNTGNGFSDEIIYWGETTWPYLRRTDEYGRSIQEIMDINADGLPDVVFKSNDGNIYVNLNTANYPTDNLLVQVSNSSGGLIKYSYKPINKQQNFYYKPTHWVVDKVTKTNRLGLAQSTGYEYYDGYYDSSRKQNRGFGKIITTDTIGNKSEMWFMQNDLQSGLPRKIIQRDYADNIYSYVYNTYENYGTTHPSHYGYGVSQTRPNGKDPIQIALFKLAQVDTYIVDGNTTVDSGTKPGEEDWKRIQKKIEYDDYGAISEIEELGLVDSNGDDIGYDKRKTVTEYQMNTDNWVYAPITKTVLGINGEALEYQIPEYEEQAKEKYYYDGPSSHINVPGYWHDHGVVEKGRLKAVEVDTGDDWVIARQYGYWNGHCIQEKDAKENVIMQRNYDPDLFEFVIMEQNAQDAIKDYEYNDIMQVISVTERNNDITTHYEYDQFGRPTKVYKQGDTSALPTVETVYDFDGIAPECVINKQRKKSGETDTLDTYTYMDGFGQKVQVKQETEDENGNLKWQTKNNWAYFDTANHQVINEQGISYLSSSSVFDRAQMPTGIRAKQIHCFDADKGNVSVAVAPDNTVTAVFNKLLETTVTNEKGYGSVSTKDGLGNVIETRTYSDTYPFDNVYKKDKNIYQTGAGNLIRSIEDYYGKHVVKSYKYDKAGRLLTSTDPDKGVWNYKYDIAGNMTNQKDANGNILRYEYDGENRLRKKKYPDGQEVNYVYGGSRLWRIVDVNNTVEYMYDGRGRLYKEKISISGINSKEFYYNYDAMDRLESITYPDGEVVENQFDKGGRINNVFSSLSRDYLLNTVYNEQGKLIENRLGNNTENHYTYYGSQRNYQLAGINIYDGNQMKKLGYNYMYDSVGNITNIDAGDDRFDQVFEYDFMNRLIEQRSAGCMGDWQMYFYNTIDNITTKGHLYVYNQSQPHAVIQASNDNEYYHYDCNGNMIKKGTPAEPEYNIIIRAKGASENGKYPIIRIYADNIELKEYYVNSDEYQDYKLNFPYLQHISELKMSYVNDYLERTLYIDYIIVNGIKIESDEDCVRYDRWDGPSLRGREYIDQNGTLRFYLVDKIVLPSACWIFNDESGDELDDSSLYNNDGTIHGATWVEGRNDQALKFDGVDDYVDCGTDNSLNITQDITIEAWIKAPNASGNRLIIQRSLDWPNVNQGYSFMLAADGRLAFSFGANNFQYSFSGKYVNDKQWHHVAVVANYSAQQGKFYIDGEEWGTFTYTGINDNPDDSLFIGSWENNAQYFQGRIDEVRIYDKPLSESQVQESYNQSIQELMAKWNMNETTGDSIYDWSGNMNTGIISGAVRTEGIDKNGLEFDGVNDYVDCGTDDKLNITEDIAIEAWIKAPSATGNHLIVQRSLDWPNVCQGYSFMLGAAGRLAFSFGVNNFQYSSYGKPINDDQWHHVAVVADYSAQEGKFYIDGEEWGTFTYTGINDNPGDTLFIGCWENNAQYFEGKMDKVCIWDKLLTVEEITYHYNHPENMGIPESGISTSYVYDYENRLTKVINNGTVTAEYAYDYSGKRIKKIENGNTIYYVNKYYEEENGIPIKYYYAGGKKVAQDKNGVLSYFHYDHLGGVALISDENGGMIKRLAYMPYGEEALTEGTGDDPKYQFTGQEKDSTGLYYYGARYYDPHLGRFLSVDPLGDDYTYCLNNPIKYTDPTGKLPKNFEEGMPIYSRDYFNIDSDANIGYKKTESGFYIETIKNVSSFRGYDSNCIGHVLDDGRSWIQGQNNLEMALFGEGYHPTDSPKAGDIVSYCFMGSVGQDRYNANKEYYNKLYKDWVEIAYLANGLKVDSSLLDRYISGLQYNDFEHMGIMVSPQIVSFMSGNNPYISWDTVGNNFLPYAPGLTSIQFDTRGDLYTTIPSNNLSNPYFGIGQDLGMQDYQFEPSLDVNFDWDFNPDFENRLINDVFGDVNSR